MLVLYNTNTGALEGTMAMSLFSEEMLSQYPPEVSFFEYEEEISPITHYHDLINTIRPRPLIEVEPSKLEFVADGVDSVLLEQLPLLAKITIGDEVFILEDPEDLTFEFSTDVAGVYNIMVECFPYITKLWEVTAIESPIEYPEA